MNFSVTILGNNSALPAHGRNPSAQIVSCNHKLYLIDCGEGTQMRMNKYGVNKMKVDHIFISHLHGDHYFGLFGLINSYRLLNRTKDLFIYSPEGLKDILAPQLERMKTPLPYALKITEVETNGLELLFENEDLQINGFPLNHGIACNGFLFNQKKRQPNIRKDKIEEFQISVEDILKVKAGKDLNLADGRVIKNEELVQAPKEPKSFAYCSDTAFDPSIVPYISRASLLYHESSFLNGEEERAKERGHATTTEAATIARDAGVGQLLLGHFSAKYGDLGPFESEARVVFPNSFLSEEGKTYEIE